MTLGIRSVSRPVAYAVGGALLVLLTLLRLYFLSSRMRDPRRSERAAGGDPLRGGVRRGKG